MRNKKRIEELERQVTELKLFIGKYFKVTCNGLGFSKVQLELLENLIKNHVK